MRLLVTGGAGFIGSNFVRYWTEQHPGDHVVAYDALTYAGNRSSLADVEDRIVFVQGDICDGPFAEKTLRDQDIDTIVHFAAESHKAGADHAVRAYGETYGLPVTITNCSNNYGPYQFPEKVIPVFTTSALDDKNLTLYATTQNRREWLHVHDHCTAIEAVLTRGRIGETYHVGSGIEASIMEIADLVLATLGKPASLKEIVPDRPGHDRRYLLDSSKLRTELGGAPEIPWRRGRMGISRLTPARLCGYSSPVPTASSAETCWTPWQAASLPAGSGAPCWAPRGPSVGWTTTSGPPTSAPCGSRTAMPS